MTTGQSKRPTTLLTRKDPKHIQKQIQPLEGQGVAQNVVTQKSRKNTFIYSHEHPTGVHETHNVHNTKNEPRSQGRATAPASEPYPHHHHGDIVRRAPLHRLVGQPVAGGFVAGVHSGLPFPPLDLLVLQGGKGVLVNREPAPHHS